MFIDAAFCRYTDDGGLLLTNPMTCDESGSGADTSLLRPFAACEGQPVSAQEQVRLQRWDFPILARDKPSDHPVVRWMRGVPAQVRDLLLAQPDEQLVFARLCATSPRARQLAASSPALLWLAGRRLLARCGDPAQVEAILGLRRQELLGRLGYPAEPRLVRLLERLGLPGLMPANARRLFSDVCKIDWLVRLLQQNPQPSWGLVRAALCNADYRKSRLFQKLLLQSTGVDRTFRGVVRVAELLQETIRVGQALLGPRGGVEQQVFACTSAQGLVHLHDTWTMKLQYEGLYHFPEPPLPGTDTLVPIRDSAVLYREGKTMDHCVFSYMEAIRAGRSYIYQMLAPARATLEIVPRGRRWILGQLRGVHNADPGPEAFRTVHKWLEQNQHGARGERQSSF